MKGIPLGLLLVLPLVQVISIKISKVDILQGRNSSNEIVKTFAANYDRSSFELSQGESSSWNSFEVCSVADYISQFMQNLFDRNKLCSVNTHDVTFQTSDNYVSTCKYFGNREDIETSKYVLSLKALNNLYYFNCL